MGLTLLGEEVVARNGPWQRVRRYYQGWVKVEGGIFIWGITGKETRVEKDVFRPKHSLRLGEIMLVAL